MANGSSRLLLSFSLIVIASAGCATAPAANPWGDAVTPTREAAEPIGGYSAGCMNGAVSLPPDGPGYQLMRLTRGRFYGQPALVQYLQQLGSELQKNKLGVMHVGDLSQPRGGPMKSGHASHQLGLDVDIWYWQHPEATTRSLTLLEREVTSAVSLLKPETTDIEPALWQPRHLRLIELAATQPGVDRIFVNAAVKRELCRLAPGAAWLRNIRPWYGHDDHLHVRLACPAGSASCAGQAPVPEGSGCDASLDWWFSDEALKKAEEPAKERALPKLPESCEQVLKADYWR